MNSKTLKFGSVATGDQHTTEAAADILQAGGNAFDAALAALACACVSEPVLASLGAGGYLLATPASGQPFVYDFFAQTPLVKRPETELDFTSIHVDFGPDTQEFHIGHGACATPGVVLALEAVSKAHGRLTLPQTLEPAIMRASQGIALGAMQAKVLQVVEPILRADADVEKLMTKGAEKALLEPGDLFNWPALADLLDALANEGADLFYRGEVGAAIAEQSVSAGGHLTRQDFISYEIAIREPLMIEHRNARIAINPPPSAGGALIGLLLRAIEAEGPLPDHADSQRYVRIAEAMQLVNEVRSRVEAVGEGSPHKLADPTIIERYKSEVAPFPQMRRGTTHISVTDKTGNAVALSVSNGEGCGRMAPYGAFMMNNMLGEEDLNPAGFHQWPRDTRLSSMMAPGVLQLPGDRRIAFGSGGSNRIRTAIAQVLISLVDDDLPLEKAIEHPRLHLEPNMLHIEAGIEPDQLPNPETFAEKNRFWPEKSLFFGGVHLAACAPNNRGDSAADSRRGGSVWAQ